MESRLEYDLQDVNRNIIALPEDEVKRNNIILGEIVRDQIVEMMKEKSALFKYLYRNIFYGGSFFCGLKVDHPNEYDLDFLLQLPEWLQPNLTLSSIPGFVQIQLEGMKQWEKGTRNHQFISNTNPTRMDHHHILVPNRTTPPSNQLLISGRKQCQFFSKNCPLMSNGVATKIAQSTVVPRRKPRADPRKVKVHQRSRKMQKLWDNIRFNKAFDSTLTREERIIFSDLINLLDDDFYLDTGKVSAWIEGIIQNIYNSFKDDGKFKLIKTSEGYLQIRLMKSGPAFTLKLRKRSKSQKITIDIDMVPAFVFLSEQWPPEPFLPNPVPEKPEFFIVPKKPDKKGNYVRCWRPSFQEQESVLINDMQNLKPCIRLLKRIRDVGNHKSIASYHLKTIFLWELENNKKLWNKPLAEVFMRMLIRCQQIFKKGVILNYWNDEDNLIKGLSRVTLDNIANNFKKIIKDIRRNPNNIFKYVDKQLLL